MRSAFKAWSMRQGNKSSSTMTSPKCMSQSPSFQVIPAMAIQGSPCGKRALQSPEIAIAHLSQGLRLSYRDSEGGVGGGGVAHLNFCPFDELSDYDVELILKFWECRVLYPSRAPGMHTEHETCQPTSYHASRPVRNGRHLHFSISRRLRQREIMNFAATFLLNARFDQLLTILNAQRWCC